MTSVHQTVEAQRAFFAAGHTKHIRFRIEQLRALRDAIRKNETHLFDALRKDLHKADVESYMTEADLRRAYGERISLLDETLKASRLGIANLRLSLLSQLRQAGDRELAGEVVPKSFRDAVRQQHDDLLRQQRILADQARDRAALDVELADALQRYRALKDPPSAQAASATGSEAATQR